MGSSTVVTQERDEDYATLGIHFDYFAIDNLSVGFEYKGWYGTTTNINQISLPVTYFVPLSFSVRPYIGVVVRETFLSNPCKNYESYGARAGISMRVSSHSYMGLGLTVEKTTYCLGYRDGCFASYPEFFYGYSF